jgi:hypothetical protein
MRPPIRAVALVACGLAFDVPAKPLAIELPSEVSAATASPYGPGTVKNVRGETITADNRSFFLNGRPWIPIVGEFHYTRYPRDEWRDELLKMKAGGINTVSTYVFWIHHEEERGTFDWHGRRSLRNFLKLCQQLGLDVIVRLGPWCHGEVRNGGFPDWVRDSGTKLRTTDPAFLKLVEPLYREEFAQMKGLLWKDGGPVIGVQVDNENGDAPYLLALKKMARAAGIDVPFYAVTGWQGGLPKDSLLPLFGGYADGFWGGTIEKYRREFIFSDVRAVNDMGAQLQSINPSNARLVAQFPYACVEIGAGMMSSYKKRIKLAPNDIASLALTKLGGGNNMPGYYMYQGGTNPDAKHSTLQEDHPNQMPLKDYDFATALGAAGQVREQYHLLREQHLFLEDFGAGLARMPAYFPAKRPASLTDFETLRWSVRWGGKSGFLFFSNEQPYEPLPEHKNVQFALETAAGTQLIPAEPITIPSGAYGIWPVNLECDGVTLRYATAQLLCRVKGDRGDIAYFFVALPGVAPEFAFAPETDGIDAPEATVEKSVAAVRVHGITAGAKPAAIVREAGGGRVTFVVLTPGQGRDFWRQPIAGRAHAFLTAAIPLMDGDELRLLDEASDEVAFSIFPPVPAAKIGDRSLAPTPDGIFAHFSVAAPRPEAALKVKAILERPAGPLATSLKGADEAAWADAAVYRLDIPQEAAGRHILLNLDYVGDAARLVMGDRLLNDQFSNGDPFPIPLWRIAGNQFGRLRFEVLPFSEGLMTRLPAAAKAKANAAKAAHALDRIPILVSEQREVRVTF